MNWTETVERYLAEGRTVSGGKGDNSQAEMQRANDISSQQLATQQQQLAMQQQQISAVNAQLDPMIAQGGMSQAQQAALTSIMMNQLPAQFNNAAGQINQNLAARGISGGQYGSGSGDIARDFGSLGAMEAGMQAQGLSNIQLQKQQQLMQDLQLKLGIGSQYGQNIGTFGNQGISALGIGQQAAYAADQASTGLWGSLLGAAGTLGTAGIEKCWIAEAIWGKHDPRTYSVRHWLNTIYAKTPIGAIVMFAYGLFGRKVAALVRRYAFIRRLLTPLFEKALRHANG